MHSRSMATGAAVAVVAGLVVLLLLGTGETTVTGGGAAVLGHKIDASHSKKLSCPTRTYTDGDGDAAQHSSRSSSSWIVPEISFNLILLTAKELLQPPSIFGFVAPHTLLPIVNPVWSWDSSRQADQFCVLPKQVPTFHQANNFPRCCANEFMKCLPDKV